MAHICSHVTQTLTKEPRFRTRRKGMQTLHSYIAPTVNVDQLPTLVAALCRAAEPSVLTCSSGKKQYSCQAGRREGHVGGGTSSRDAPVRQRTKKTTRTIIIILHLHLLWFASLLCDLYMILGLQSKGAWALKKSFNTLTVTQSSGMIDKPCGSKSLWPSKFYSFNSFNSMCVTWCCLYVHSIQCVLPGVVCMFACFASKHTNNTR